MCHYLSHLGSFGLPFSAQASLSIVFTMEGKLQILYKLQKRVPITLLITVPILISSLSFQYSIRFGYFVLEVSYRNASK